MHEKEHTVKKKEIKTMTKIAKLKKWQKTKTTEILKCL